MLTPKRIYKKWDEFCRKLLLTKNSREEWFFSFFLLSFFFYQCLNNLWKVSESLNLKPEITWISSSECQRNRKEMTSCNCIVIVNSWIDRRCREETIYYIETTDCIAQIRSWRFDRINRLWSYSIADWVESIETEVQLAIIKSWIPLTCLLFRWMKHINTTNINLGIDYSIEFWLIEWSERLKRTCCNCDLQEWQEASDDDTQSAVE